MDNHVSLLAAQYFSASRKLAWRSSARLGFTLFFLVFFAILFRSVDRSAIQRNQRHYVIPQIGDDGGVGLQCRNGARLG